MVIDPGTPYLTFDPSALDYMLINAVKELDTRTAAMDTARIAQLESRLTQKDLEIAELKAMMREILNNQNRFDSDLQQCCFEHSSLTSVQRPVTSVADAPKLEQNIPNPFHENTTIKYYLPSGMRTASIIITDLSGVQMKQFDLSGGKGFGQVLISGGAFAAGTYIYTLTVDGKVVDSKRMVLL
jgi:ribosomal protein L32E